MAGDSKAEFLDHLQGILTDWSNSPEKDLNSFLAERVGAEDGSAILETIALISSAHTEIAHARQQGQTRAGWLGEELSQHIPAEQWSDFLESPLQHLEGVSKGMTASALASTLVDLSASSFAISGEPELSSLIAAETAVPVLQEATDFFTSPLGSATEAPIKAVVSAGAATYTKQKSLQVPVAAVTASIDLGLSTAKVAYKVATEEMDLAEGISHLQDRACAGIAAVVRQVAPQVGESVGQAVGGLLGGWIGMAPAGAAAGRVLGRMAGEYVAKHAEAGVRKIVSVVKTTVQKTASTIWKTAKSFVGGLFGA